MFKLKCYPVGRSVSNGFFNDRRATNSSALNRKNSWALDTFKFKKSEPTGTLKVEKSLSHNVKCQYVTFEKCP